MEEYIGKHVAKEKILSPTFEACFHGECWYRCPKCNHAFEAYDPEFERGFIHINDKIYRHECGQLLKMS